MTAIDFEPLAEELQQLVEPELGRDRLVTVGQLRAGGEPFHALRDLTVVASRFRIAVPCELRDRIVAAVDRMNMPDDPDVKDIKTALSTAAGGSRKSDPGHSGHKYTPFGRNDPSILGITDEDARKLQGRPAPLRIIVPVVIEDED